jgi:hypothetical protein
VEAVGTDAGGGDAPIVVVDSGVGHTPETAAEGGDCSAGSVRCAEACVSTNDPGYGCGTCKPCPSPANSASTTCTAGSCTFTCESGYSVCRGGCCPKSYPHAVVLFGGTDNAKEMSDTWLFDGTVWTQVPGPGPSARQDATMVGIDGKVILFGGYGPVGSAYYAFSDTWSFDGTSWTQLAVEGPPARSMASATNVNGKVVLFGGFASDAVDLSDTWVFDGTAWTQLQVPGPSARDGASMAALSGMAVLAGGEGCDLTTPDCGNPNDSWRFDGTTWTQLAGQEPGTGLAAAATLGNEVVLFGGWDGSYFRSDTWVFDGSKWATLTVPAAPSPRRAVSAAGLPGRVVLFGGYDANNAYSDTWLDGTSWTKLNVAGPPGRWAAAMAAW